MGRANRQGSGGADGLRESTPKQSSLLSAVQETENLMGSNFENLREVIDSGTISFPRVSYHSGEFERATSEFLRQGNVQKLAEVMERVDSDFDKKQFLAAVLDENGQFQGATAEDYKKAVEKEMEKNLWRNEGSGGRNPVTEEKIASRIASIIDDVVASPSGNKLYRPDIDKDLWIEDKNMNTIGEAWEKAGGSRELLEGRLRPIETVAASAGLINHPNLADEGITSYADRDSDQYFIEGNKYIYGNQRSYNIVIDDEDRNVNVREVRNKDGRALQVSSHDIKISVVQAANPTEDGSSVVRYDVGDGPQKATSDQKARVGGSLEGLALDLLREEVRARQNPSSQADRLFEQISSS